jgi:hypothetical protein
MDVIHEKMNVRDEGAGGNTPQAINLMMEQAKHQGVKQFRVGEITTTLLQTAVPVTFTHPLEDAYEVFIQPKSGVSVTTYPSNQSADGFTLNLTLGVNATFAYFAVGHI